MLSGSETESDRIRKLRDAADHGKEEEEEKEEEEAPPSVRPSQSANQQSVRQAGSDALVGGPRRRPPGRERGKLLRMDVRRGMHRVDAERPITRGLRQTNHWCH